MPHPIQELHQVIRNGDKSYHIIEYIIVIMFALRQCIVHVPVRHESIVLQHRSSLSSIALAEPPNVWLSLLEGSS